MRVGFEHRNYLEHPIFSHVQSWFVFSANPDVCVASYDPSRRRSDRVGEEIDAELGGERAQILDGREVHGDPRF